jgi:hypothetical protein
MKQEQESLVEQELDQIMQSHGRCTGRKTFRKDVINKTIIRGLKRHIAGLFVTGRNLPR